MRFRSALLAFAIACVPAGSGAWAGQSAPPAGSPSPAETHPLPTTTQPGAGTPQGEAGSEPTTVPRPAQSGAAPAATPPAAALPTLVQTPGALNDVDSVTLPAKPAAILSGRTKWEEAVPNLKDAFRRIEAELAKAGIAPAGRPVTVFIKTEEDGFQFDAMVPLAAAPANPPQLEGLRFGSTPSGRALRFRHSGSYDEIDGTYETLTAYLDAKDIPVQDSFVEEYVSDLSDGVDEKLDVNIYALTK